MPIMNINKFYNSIIYMSGIYVKRYPSFYCNDPQNYIKILNG